MRKAAILVILATLALVIVGCNKEEAPASTAASTTPATAPGKGNDDVASAEMQPGPGAAEAESRVGSKLGDR